ncbi:MAG: ribonuclease R [Gemmataceae bacterium]
MKDRILQHVSQPGYTPLKPRGLARALGVTDADYGEFRRALKDMVNAGKLAFGKSHQVKPAGEKGAVLLGIFRRTPNGRGFVRPQAIEGKPPVKDIPIAEGRELDAATGDEVQISFLPSRGEGGVRFAAVVRVLERATRQFVGVYHERDGDGLVRVDAAVFSHSIYVGDPGAKGAKPDDKVVIEMLRFPSPEDAGEGVIVEVLGKQGTPGVDTLSVIRAYDLPDKFSEDALEEARTAAAGFHENDLEGREDLTGELIITIDPAEARDFDDAISLTRDEESGHWLLGVHIADVGHFAQPGGALDAEARTRATSVYLPQKVIPMFPELISNGLASLQEGKVRFTKSAFIDFTPQGQKVSARFANTAIKNRKRFTYEQVSDIYSQIDAKKTPPLSNDLMELLLRMRELALILRGRRRKKGALELTMPEPVLEYDAAGKVSGAHFAVNDISHQVIEEFMLAANVAVAEQLDDLEVPFLRRIHPPPEPRKLTAFAEFVRSLGYKLDRHTDRFGLQKVLERSATRPNAPAVNYAMLRSFKQAVYSAYEEEHYALAFKDYCHFTSPIRRYPDLTVHRLLDRWLKHRRVTADMTETLALGEHCSKMEKRAEAAERELVKLRLLDFMSTRIGEAFDAVITGVADYGFFAMCSKFPAEGRVHISTLTDDYYVYEESAHTLTGKRTKKRYRLGDTVRVEVVRVDLTRRQLDFRVASEKAAKTKKKPDRTSRERKRRE